MPQTVHGWVPTPAGAGGEAPPPGAAPGAAGIVPPALARPLALIARPRVRDQGEVGCCVSIACTAALELLLPQERGRPPELSPLFHYWQARADRSVAAPISIFTGLQALVTHGICHQRLHPQPLTLAATHVPPSEAALADAKAIAGARFDPVTGVRRGHFAFFRVPDHDRRAVILHALAAGKPVVFGFWQTPGYCTITGARPVHGRELEPREAIGHAALIIGHHPRRGMQVLDAKGPAFAARGTWWLPDDLLQGPLVQESWFLQRND